MATKKEQAPADGLVCIKGFDSSLKCRGMQYADRHCVGYRTGLMLIALFAIASPSVLAGVTRRQVPRTARRGEA